MTDLPTPDGIPPEDWATTPASVRAWVILLQTALAHLQQEVAELKERLNQTSRNSSKPPSSDPPGAKPAPPTPSSGRQVGGQPGHPGRSRVLKAVTQVAQVVDLRPVACGECGALLLGDDPAPVRRQITELPRPTAEITEYRQHRLPCLHCGAHTAGAWPADLPTGSFGPRLQATVGYLTGRLALSQRDTEEALGTLFHTAIGLGSVPAQEAVVSAALEKPVADAVAYVQAQPTNNVDETSWPEGPQRGWLWVNHTPWVTVFFMLAHRSADCARQVIGQLVDKVVGTDRYSAYHGLVWAVRQVCWAHLRRDFQALVDRGGASAAIGQDLLAQAEQLFTLWHQTRAGPLSRADFQTQVEPIRQQVAELLREGQTVAHPKTVATCTKILAVEASLWTFVEHAGVEPTNNGAERALRRAVLWRRRSFGTQSEAGSRFVERILTTVTTLRLQHRDVLDYLTQACAAANQHRQAPSLLPAVPTPTSVSISCTT